VVVSSSVTRIITVFMNMPMASATAGSSRPGQPKAKRKSR
jgi:hypothetical protein